MLKTSLLALSGAICPAALRCAVISTTLLMSTTALLLASTAEAQPAQPAPPAGEEKPPAKAEGSAALAVPENPPPPPAAGSGQAGAPVAPVPKTFADEASLALRDGASGEPIAGWHGMFFLRDPDGNFRLSPTGDMMLDFTAAAGPGVDDLPSSKGGAGLVPRFFVRRLRVGITGDFLKRWSFAAAFDLAQQVNNPLGTDETSAAPPGVDPTADSGRYRPPQGLDAGIGLRDVWVNYSLCPCLNFQVGQFQPPMTLENRTSDTVTPLMERSVATRTFIVPGQREAGLMLWGDFGDDVFTYELAVVGGDGQNRATVDMAADFIGRLLLAPLKSVKLIKDARIGVSARHGQRDAAVVGYDVVPFSTNNGFVLWEPQYRDSLGRRTHVIPSGAQNTIGGELVFPIGPVDIATTHLNSRAAAGVDYQRTHRAYRRQVQFLHAFVEAQRSSAHPLILAGDFNLGKRPVRLRAFNAAFPHARNSLAELRRSSPAGPAHSSDADMITEKARDFQLLFDGKDSAFTPLAAEIPFGTEEDGAMLSDHLGYTIRYRLARRTPAT